MSNYAKRKEQAIQEAIEWQLHNNDTSTSYGELAEAQTHFAKLAHRYGLVKEFTENGII